MSLLLVSLVAELDGEIRRSFRFIPAQLTVASSWVTLVDTSICSYRLHQVYLAGQFNHHHVKLKYGIRSAFRCNSTWESCQKKDLRM